MSELDDYLQAQAEAMKWETIPEEQQQEANLQAKAFVENLSNEDLDGLITQARDQRFPMYLTFNSVDVPVDKLLQEEKQFRTIREAIKDRESNPNWGTFA